MLLKIHRQPVKSLRLSSNFVHLINILQHLRLRRSLKNEKEKKNKKIIVHTSMMVGGKEEFIIQRNRIEKRTCESSQWNFADHT